MIHSRRIGEFGTCYTAGSIEVAFAESVIHESGRFVAGAHEVPAIELAERSVVRYRCERRKTLVLADLTGVALKFLGLNKRHQRLRRLRGESGLGPGDSRREPALGRHPIRVAADEQGVCLRDLRAQRARQAAGRQAQGTASRCALRSVQCHCGVTACALARHTRMDRGIRRSRAATRERPSAVAGRFSAGQGGLRPTARLREFCASHPSAQEHLDAECGLRAPLSR